MPTIIGHAISGLAISSSIIKKHQWHKVVLAGIICAVIPDLDVLAFRFGIPYENTFGHRGFTHSIFFSVLLGILTAFLFKPENTMERAKYVFIFSCCALSHCLFDACTNGGLGVAFFSPFSNERYFFAWQPIEVSPISIKKFLTTRGLAVLKSEFIWVILPSFVFGIIVSATRYYIKLKR